MNDKLIEDSYEYCKQICKSASTTFYSSFSALDVERRKAVHCVYALCRWIDDIVDGDDQPVVEESVELLEQTKERNIILRDIHADITLANPV